MNISTLFSGNSHLKSPPYFLALSKFLIISAIETPPAGLGLGCWATTVIKIRSFSPTPF